MDTKAPPQATVRSSQGWRQNATNLYEYNLKFINHDITYTELLDALSTK